MLLCWLTLRLWQPRLMQGYKGPECWRCAQHAHRASWQREEGLLVPGTYISVFPLAVNSTGRGFSDHIQQEYRFINLKRRATERRVVFSPRCQELQHMGHHLRLSGTWWSWIRSADQPDPQGTVTGLWVSQQAAQSYVPQHPLRLHFWLLTQRSC